MAEKRRDLPAAPYTSQVLRPEPYLLRLVGTTAHPLLPLLPLASVPMNCLALFCILTKSLPNEVVQSKTRTIKALFLSSVTVVELAGLNSVSLSQAPVLVCFHSLILFISDCETGLPSI